MPQPSLEVNMRVKAVMPPTTQQPERTVELAEGPLELGLGDESEPGHESELKDGNLKQKTESDDQSLQQTAALRKLNNTWTGSPPTMLSSRTKSSGGAVVPDGQEAILNVVLARDEELEHEAVALYHIAVDVAFHAHVPRTPTAQTVGRHLDSSFIIFPDYNVVVDRRRQKALHL